MVAVGLSPRNNGSKECASRSDAGIEEPIEPFKRRSATPGFCAPSPWAKAHGYRPSLALRGTLAPDK